MNGDIILQKDDIHMAAEKRIVFLKSGCENPYIIITNRYAKGKSSCGMRKVTML
jgi:hypothetical protein